MKISIFTRALYKLYNPGTTLARGEQEQNSLESFENQRLLQQAVDVSRKEITLVGGLVINNGW